MKWVMIYYPADSDVAHFFRPHKGIARLAFNSPPLEFDLTLNCSSYFGIAYITDPHAWPVFLTASVLGCIP